MRNEPRESLTIEVSRRTVACLAALGNPLGYKTAAETVAYLVSSVVDGVRRPWSWERQVLKPLFGEEGIVQAAFELRDEK